VPQSSLTFALHSDGHTVHVDEVANGLACESRCPSCGDRLIAKHGNEIAHHFAHESGAECARASESALHLAAKAILERERRIVVPQLTATGTARDALFREYQATCSMPSTMVTLDRVELEVMLDGNRPDILATVGEKTLIVEIAVTSFANEEKIRRLASQGIAAIEVDLSEIDRLANWESISDAVIDRISNKRWLFNPKAPALQSKADREAKELADQAESVAIATQVRTKRIRAYERTHTPGFQDELKRFREFIAPENQAALREQIPVDGQDDDAWQSVVVDSAARWEAPPPYLNVPVPGELKFLVDRRVWQAGIFTTFIRRSPRKDFSRDEVVKWAYKCFEHRDGFPILDKNKALLSDDERKMLVLISNPVTNYLKALEEMGFIAIKPKVSLTDKTRWKILRWG